LKVASCMCALCSFDDGIWWWYLRLANGEGPNKHPGGLGIGSPPPLHICTPWDLGYLGYPGPGIWDATREMCYVLCAVLNGCCGLAAYYDGIDQQGLGNLNEPPPNTALLPTIHHKPHVNGHCLSALCRSNPAVLPLPRCPNWLRATCARAQPTLGFLVCACQSSCPSHIRPPLPSATNESIIARRLPLTGLE
jgi:hypothetical protein